MINSLPYFEYFTIKAKLLKSSDAKLKGLKRIRYGSQFTEGYFFFNDKLNNLGEFI